jgi:OmpR family response regulator RpaB
MRTQIGLLAQHLSHAAYHVITAVSGTTGLQMFYDHHPDLVILDIMMPKMNG